MVLQPSAKAGVVSCGRLRHRLAASGRDAGHLYSTIPSVFDCLILWGGFFKPPSESKGFIAKKPEIIKRINDTSKGPYPPGYRTPDNLETGEFQSSRCLSIQGRANPKMVTSVNRVESHFSIPAQPIENAV